ncbi:translation initiation factor IF-3 [candidate division WWE3 bacterium CG_4_9_14_0_2_um_filter_35_11]|uniref:Translation initiation factor IF-3 n=1 Tax=candidate division WWE3 bacterium CG_4_9_14_0_2_um_filter_35_11 TaxID=1975077 RepID=A0A2M8EL89_UNCKA|nr:MAG: translation initiation factor IF-3 [candidate division WWE3 bacterium CG10_big_fil_rev_8_21_14_0_10_35_32]PJC23485.1 MAG: translation initiation factor IF-3 [candidate division WWE3 bacterium CG_4_9_14_0_2_um_filter_35_11]
MYLKLNEKIGSKEVRLIDQNGENVGVKSRDEAIKMAKELGLDLLEVSGSAVPPVCKIIDYNKYLYEQKGKLKKSKSKKTELKEFTMSPNISEGDLNVRIKRAKEFLEDGNMVKFTVKFKGREATYPERGEIKIKIIESELNGMGKVERPLQMVGQLMTVTFMPVSK